MADLINFESKGLVFDCDRVPEVRKKEKSTCKDFIKPTKRQIQSKKQSGGGSIEVSCSWHQTNFTERLTLGDQAINIYLVILETEEVKVYATQTRRRGVLKLCAGTHKTHTP